MMKMEEYFRNRNWFHSIKVNNDITTNGYDPTQEKIFNNFHCIPESFEGKTVLDIGAYDGAWSFEAAKRGSKRVLATDGVCWENGYHYENFKTLRKHFGYETIVEDKFIYVEDLKTIQEKFDYVFIFGVIYHSQNPIQYLQNAFHCLKEGGTIIIESVTDMLDYNFPCAAIYGSEYTLNNDDSNVFGMNELGLLELMKKVGMKNAKCEATNYKNLVNHAVTPYAQSKRPFSGDITYSARSTFTASK